MPDKNGKECLCERLSCEDDDIAGNTANNAQSAERNESIANRAKSDIEEATETNARGIFSDT